MLCSIPNLIIVYWSYFDYNALTGTTRDNIIVLSIPIWVDSKLVIGGSSKPADVHYDESLYTSETITKESQIGPQVIHLYTISNGGSSSIKETELMFIWPQSTLEGDDLLYLLDQPHIYPRGSAKCEVVNANYKNYELESRKSIWDLVDVGTPGGYPITDEFHGGKITPGIEKNITTGILFNETHTGKVIDSNSGDGSGIHGERDRKIWEEEQRRREGGGISAGVEHGGGIQSVTGGGAGGKIKIVENITRINVTVREPTIINHYNHTVVYDQYGNVIRNYSTHSQGSVAGDRQIHHSNSGGSSGASFTYGRQGSSSSGSSGGGTRIYGTSTGGSSGEYTQTQYGQGGGGYVHTSGNF